MNALCDQLRKEIEDDPQGRLSLASRVELWRALGPCEMRGAYALPGPGLRRRLALAAETVRWESHLWQTEEGDDAPLRMCLLASQVVGGSGSVAEARQAIGSLRKRVLDILYLNPDSRTAYAGMAAHKVLRISFSDEDLLRMDPLPQDELGLDPDLTDAAFCSSIAASGGAWWQQTADTSVRRGFWLKYVNTAEDVQQDQLTIDDVIERYST